MTIASALQKAKPAIVEHFDNSRPRAYQLADLRKIVKARRAAWQLPASTRAADVINLLVSDGGLREVALESEGGVYRDIARYEWGRCTPIELALTLKASAYFTHGTAVFLHGFTEQVPRTTYINHEQSPKPAPKQSLSQLGIDRAFLGKQRLSKYSFVLDDNRYTILSGKNTARYGVEAMRGPSGEHLQVTNPERTLVDIVVRPAYAGGAYQVLEAYRTAVASGVSVSRILATLKSLDYKYPYHQAIGFLLERAGLEPAKLKRLRDLGTDFDFYLGYGLKDPDLDPSWRIFHPKGFLGRAGRLT